MLGALVLCNISRSLIGLASVSRRKASRSSSECMWVTSDGVSSRAPSVGSELASASWISLSFLPSGRLAGNFRLSSLIDGSHNTTIFWTSSKFQCQLTAVGWGVVFSGSKIYITTALPSLYLDFLAAGPDALASSASTASAAISSSAVALFLLLGD